MTVAHDLIVAPQARPLTGSIPSPSDPRIAQLALLCAALAEGDSEIRWLSQGKDVETMARALRSLGVRIDADERSARVRGVGLAGFAPAAGAIDCERSWSVLAELAGVLVSRPFATVLDVRGEGVDLAGLAGALRGRGGQIEGRFSATQAGRIMPPLMVGPLSPRVQLSEVDRVLERPQAEIKSALLFSGLFADGPTYVHERVMSPDHLVRLLDALDVPIASAGSAVELDPANWSGKVPGFSYDVPGDLSAAMIFLAAASLVEGSRVCVRGVGLNPMRTGGIDVLRALGGAVDVEVHEVSHGEPKGTACASFAPLRSASVSGETLVRARSDIAVLLALAARARGVTEISGVLEIAVGEDGRLARLAEVLKRFGVEAECTGERMLVEGRPEGFLRAAEIEAAENSDAGVAAILLGLCGDAPTVVRGVDATSARFPRLVGTLRALGAEARLESR
jgi:3-phosphoshikimate 1-carboxyvinyltransferase